MKFLTFSIVISAILFSCKSTDYKGLDDGMYANLKTNKGDVLLKLFAKEVPLTVSNFVSLAEGNHPKVTDSLQGVKYFDGLRFYRVVPDFIIQAGDRSESGRGNPGYKFGDEFPRDSTKSLLYKHDFPGVLSMANPGPASNGSQFFITHKATPWLDGKHSVFGEVVLLPSEKKEFNKAKNDSLDVSKSLDSLRMNVINRIVKNDTIFHVEIIRLGKFAKNFDAPNVFKKQIAGFDEKEKQRLDGLDKVKKAFLDSSGIENAIKTESGLQILTLEKGTGKKVTTSDEIIAVYSLHLSTGQLISKNTKEEPFVFTIDNQPMIAGFKEGILTMKEGGRVRLFIPSYIGYGDSSNGPIPGKSDLVFELEVIKVGK
jgi:cyclophilin family peptidyl-prolyl cis-trans isomerase